MFRHVQPHGAHTYLTRHSDLLFRLLQDMDRAGVLMLRLVLQEEEELVIMPQGVRIQNR